LILSLQDREGLNSEKPEFRNAPMEDDSLQHGSTDSQPITLIAGSKRERWSLVTTFWVACGVICLSAVIVFQIAKQPIWIEFETLALVGGAMMTLFYTMILYKGVYFDENEQIVIIRPTSSAGLELVEFGDFGEITGGLSDGPLGLLFGFLLDILVTFVLSFVLALLYWLGVNILFIGVVAVSLPTFYLFKRSLFFVLKHVDECHGKLVSSFAYAIGYSAVKTALLCGMIFVGHGLAVWGAGL
jgi:hypothetical protein